MDPNLLDRSRYRITSLSLDSRFADTYYPPSVTYASDNCIPNTGTADFMIRLPSPLKNIMRVALASVELPEVEYLFSSKNGNLNFWVKVGDAEPVNLAIPAGNYKYCELETQLNAVLAPYGLTAVINPIDGLIAITSTTSPFTIGWASNDGEVAARAKDWGLGYNLGFRQRVVTASLDGSGNYVMTGTSIVRIQPSAYYLLQLLVPDQVEALTHRVSQGGSVPAFAKLVLREDWYHIQFDDGGNNMRKEFTFLTPTTVSAVRLRLLDPYGRLVQMFDMDWSVTLEFYEVMNSRAANVIGQGYGR